MVSASFTLRAVCSGIIGNFCLSAEMQLLLRWINSAPAPLWSEEFKGDHRIGHGYFVLLHLPMAIRSLLPYTVKFLMTRTSLLFCVVMRINNPHPG